MIEFTEGIYTFYVYILTNKNKNIMIGLETAAAYVLGIITENEDFKKFPKEFVGESIKWVKSWFLTPEDPKATAKLIDPDKSIEVKKDIIADKLAELKDNPTFQTELTEKIQLYEHHRRQLLNNIENSDIEVKGNFKQSNTIGTGSSDSDATNSIKHSKIVVGGDFTQGNDIFQGHTTVYNNFYAPHPSATSAAPPQYKAVKNELKALMAKGKIKEAIEKNPRHHGKYRRGQPQHRPSAFCPTDSAQK